MIVESDVWQTDLIRPHVWYLTTGGHYAISERLSRDIDGDFTLIGWYKGLQESDLPVRLWDIGQFDIEMSGVAGNVVVKMSDSYGSQSQSVNWDLVTWSDIIVVRAGTTTKVFYGGSELLSVTRPAVENHGSLVCAVTEACYIFDLKVLPRAMTLEDIAYYRDNIINHGGDAVLPNF